MDTLLQLAISYDPDEVKKLETKFGISQSEAVSYIMDDPRLRDHFCSPAIKKVSPERRKEILVTYVNNKKYRIKRINDISNKFLLATALLGVASLYSIINFTVNSPGQYWTIIAYILCCLFVFSLSAASGLYISATNQEMRAIRFLWAKIFSLVFTAITGEIVLYAQLFSYYGISDGKAQIHDFLPCLYFSAITYTTVGYGDFFPSGGWSRFFAASEALTGILLNAVLIATLIAAFRPRE